MKVQITKIVIPSQDPHGRETGYQTTISVVPEDDAEGGFYPFNKVARGVFEVSSCSPEYGQQHTSFTEVSAEEADRRTSEILDQLRELYISWNKQRTARSSWAGTAEVTL